MEFTRTSDRASGSQSAERCCPIVELRQYTLHPGQRETLIELFDREFVETQEALGMTIVGQFRDLDRPNVFTWIRGFQSMASRPKSLEAFYNGPVWARHRAAANATMISSDNVRLLHPVPRGQGFAAGPRAAPGTTAVPPGLIVATIYTLIPSVADGFLAVFDRTVMPVLKSHGAEPIAVFETERSANNFQRLPVREGERSLVWFARFDDVAAYDRYLRALAADRRWTATVRPELERSFATPAETWRLTPTARSRVLR
jgi:hypothetical protein